MTMAKWGLRHRNLPLTKTKLQITWHTWSLVIRWETRCNCDWWLSNSLVRLLVQYKAILNGFWTYMILLLSTSNVFLVFDRYYMYQHSIKSITRKGRADQQGKSLTISLLFQVHYRIIRESTPILTTEYIWYTYSAKTLKRKHSHILFLVKAWW